MAVTFSELNSNPLVFQSGENPRAELGFIVQGTDDRLSAIAIAESGCPLKYDFYQNESLILSRSDVSISRRANANDIWDVRATYSPFAYHTSESTFEFSTGGGTEHITNALDSTNYGPDSAIWTPPDHKTAIGVQDDGESVNGVDIDVAVYRFSERHFLPASQVTPAYKANLYYLTNRINDDDYKGFEAGELKLKSVLGSIRQRGDWDFRFDFEASPNRLITIGEGADAFTDVPKKGWQYLEVRHQKIVDDVSGFTTFRPIAVYVHDVYYDGDFSLLGIPE